MKKNRAMRIAALLLVLTMMTSCFVGGTFAKYTTGTENLKDNARVANWGVTVTGTGVAFSDSYRDAATVYDALETGTGITVQSATPDDKVIAPGTNGTLAAFTVEGTPEVDVQVTYTATLKLEGWKIGADEYCPLIFTVNTVKYYIGMPAVEIDSVTYNVDDIDGLIAVVQAAIVDKGAYYDANTDLSTVNDDLTVSWEWEFEKATVNFQNDDKDTDLGDLAADGTAPTIELSVNCTIDQVN